MCGERGNRESGQAHPRLAPALAAPTLQLTGAGDPHPSVLRPHRRVRLPCQARTFNSGPLHTYGFSPSTCLSKLKGLGSQTRNLTSPWPFLLPAPTK